MSILSSLYELTKDEIYGNKELFEKCYNNASQALNDLGLAGVEFNFYDNGQSINIYIDRTNVYALNYTSFYDVKFITSIYNKDGLVKEYPFSYDSDICKEIERKHENSTL